MQMDEKMDEKKLEEGSFLLGDKQRRKRPQYWIVLLIIFLVSVVTLAVLTPLVFLKSSTSSESSKHPSSATYSRAAVASDVGLCSDGGARILKRGGSAVDAAVATMLCNGVVNPHSSGLGGGAFMLIYNASSRSGEVIDAREVAPKDATEGMFIGREHLSTLGGLAVAVPGELAGMHLAWERHGNLSWSELFEPAIEVAENGFRVGFHLAHNIMTNENYILADKGLRELFTTDNSTLLKEGDLLKQPTLAKFFRNISANPAEFYNGDLARTMVDDLRSNGGIIREDDFRDYRPLIRDLLPATFQNLTSYGAPPPASGAVVHLILEIIDLYTENSWDITSTTSYQRIVEAMKYAFGQHQTLGDPAFNPIVNATLNNMTNPSTVRRMFEQILDNRTFQPEHYTKWFDNSESHGTSHVSVLAENGDAVAVTTTVNTAFGSKIRSPSLGIIYNNEMDDFATPNHTNSFGLPPSESNYIAPGKRPQSSMSPTVMVNEDGQVQMVIGASGGSRIITAIALSVINNRIFNNSIGPAIERARCHHQLVPNNITIEETPYFPESIALGLRNIGHIVNRYNVRSVVQGIVLKDGQIDATCDTRKGGYPAGY